MLQILQNLSNGETSLVDVPSPKSMKGHINIQTTKSIVSVGTERMLVEFGKAGLVEKAYQQPDKVKKAIERIRNDGLRIMAL